MKPRSKPPYRRVVKPRQIVKPSRWNLFENHLRNSTVSMEARALFGVLATFSDKQGKKCFPKVETILLITGWAEGTFYRYRAELLEIGWIKAISRIARTGRSSTAYELFWDWPESGMAITSNPGGTLPSNLGDRGMYDTTYLKKDAIVALADPERLKEDQAKYG